MAHPRRKFAARPKPDPVPTKPPRQRWNDRRIALFFDHLALTCNVTESLRVSGLSSSVLYRRRRESADFRAAWDEALEEGYSRLEAELLNRALNGETHEVVNRNGEVVTIRKACTGLGLALLKFHSARVAAFRDLEAKKTNGKTHGEHVLDAKVTILKRLEQLALHRLQEGEARAEPAACAH